MAGGRPTDYTDELVAKAWSYVDNYKEQGDVIPSVVGLCRVIYRARSTVYAWADDEDKEFSDILDALKENQERALVNKGLTGEHNSTITKLILTKHDYSDKVDNTHGGGDRPIEVTAIERTIVHPSNTDG